MDKINEIKKLLPTNIEEDLLISAIFDVSRKYDNLFIKEIKKIKETKEINIDSIERNSLRKSYYYSLPNKYNLKFTYTEEQLHAVLDDFLARLKNYDAEIIVSSLMKRIEDVGSNRVNYNTKTWLSLYDKKRQKWQYSLLILKINQELYKKLGYSIDKLTSFISNIYDKLENYRYLAIVFDGKIYNKVNYDITWQIIYKISLFAENFRQFNGNFFAFKREKQIKKLEKFLQERNIKEYKILATSFYQNISYGFKFEDCYLSDDLDKKILILRKIELDEENVPCPSCLTTIQNGNSYPEMFLRSWECKNSTCPDRSKSGRGKRFDEYGAYRYFKLSEGEKENIISDTLYKNWHRDIFASKLDYLEFLIKAYSWNKENICLVNFNEIANDWGRKILYSNTDNLFTLSDMVYETLPIYSLFKSIFREIKQEQVKGNVELSEKLVIINDNSSLALKKLLKNQIGSVITSPPYYNAREYSQWENLILYLIDMMINSYAVYNSMTSNAYYLYNIGDIVAEDNIYINSNMSKHRIQLGFLSCMFFEIVGYKLDGNIVWDKGEVQSKRNSTINLFSGYVKPVNCYEHMFVFCKGKSNHNNSKIVKISPVIKINNKGENTYKHTAPYPVELVSQIEEYVYKDKYILDPYLGSGTTLVWCKQKGYKGIGYELNKVYYNLCKERVSKSDNNKV